MTSGADVLNGSACRKGASATAQHTKSCTLAAKASRQDRGALWPLHLALGGRPCSLCRPVALGPWRRPAVRIVQRKLGWREVGDEEDWEVRSTRVCAVVVLTQLRAYLRRVPPGSRDGNLGVRGVSSCAWLTQLRMGRQHMHGGQTQQLR